MTWRCADLGHLVEPPRRYPWMPPPPPFTSAESVMLPDLATLQRVLEGLRRL